MNLSRKPQLWKFAILTTILLMSLLASVVAEEDNSPVTTEPSFVLFGAGARWAARNGTSALYVNWRDNYDAHHLTDGANWGPWMSEEELDKEKTTVMNILEMQGFVVECSADVPETISNYDLVVFEAYFAVEPRHSPLVKEYLADGGSVVLIGGVPCYFDVYRKDWWPYRAVGAEFDGLRFGLSSIQEWFGARYYINDGGNAQLAFDNPFGTTLLSKDPFYYSYSYSCAGLNSLNSNSTVIALWEQRTISNFFGQETVFPETVFAFIHEYGKGRVYYQSRVETLISEDFTPIDDTPIVSPGISTSISISTDMPSSFAGFTVPVYGTLNNTFGNSLFNKTVFLYYTFPGYESWIPVTSDTTDEFGEYYINWIPPAAGSFTLKAEWKGNTTHSGSSGILSLNTIPYENEHVFSVESNSTLSSLIFNAVTSELGFSVTGPSGTTGYTNVVIPKSLVNGISNLTVYVDEDEMSFSSTSRTDAWEIQFTYSHSTHQVVVKLESVPPESEPETPIEPEIPETPEEPNDELSSVSIPLELILALVAIAAIIVVAVVGYKMGKSKGLSKADENNSDAI